jgi:hypothetical protein
MDAASHQQNAPSTGAASPDTDVRVDLSPWKFVPEGPGRWRSDVFGSLPDGDVRVEQIPASRGGGFALLVEGEYQRLPAGLSDAQVVEAVIAALREAAEDAAYRMRALRTAADLLARGPVGASD